MGQGLVTNVLRRGRLSKTEAELGEVGDAVHVSALPLSRIAMATLANREGEVATEGEEDAGEARKKERS